jgi:hypothetical protein
VFLAHGAARTREGRAMDTSFGSERSSASRLQALQKFHHSEPRAGLRMEQPHKSGVRTGVFPRMKCPRERVNSTAFRRIYNSPLRGSATMPSVSVVLLVTKDI